MDESSPEVAENPYATPQSALSGTGSRSIRMSCPHCHVLTNHLAVKVVRERTGGRILLFLVTGIVFYSLWEAQKPRLFACTCCEGLSWVRTPGGKLAENLFFFLIALLLAVLLWPNL
jgi:hypothetical protein